MMQFGSYSKADCNTCKKFYNFMDNQEECGCLNRDEGRGCEYQKYVYISEDEVNIPCSGGDECSV